MNLHFKRNRSAGTAAEKNYKCSWLAGRPLLLAILMLCAVFCRAQNKVKWDDKPCPIDTIKGILYRSWYSGQTDIDTGYFIGYCGGIQLGNMPYFDGNKTIKYPTWIPGRYLRNDNADKSGNQIYGQDWEW